MAGDLVLVSEDGYIATQPSSGKVTVGATGTPCCCECAPNCFVHDDGCTRRGIVSLRHVITYTETYSNLVNWWPDAPTPTSFTASRTLQAENCAATYDPISRTWNTYPLATIYVADSLEGGNPVGTTLLPGNPMQGGPGFDRFNLLATPQPIPFRATLKANGEWFYEFDNTHQWTFTPNALPLGTRTCTSWRGTHTATQVVDEAYGPFADYGGAPKPVTP